VLDFCEPFEVFSSANRFMDTPAFSVITVAEKVGPIHTLGGMSVNAQRMIAEVPSAELLLIPGGQGTRKEMHNQVVIECIAAGIDMSLYIVGKILGEEIAQKTEDYMECPVPWPTTHE